MEVAREAIRQTQGTVAKAAALQVLIQVLLAPIGFVFGRHIQAVLTCDLHIRVAIDEIYPPTRKAMKI